MGLIRRSYTYLDKNSLFYFFNALIRLHLEYYVSIWYPLLKTEKDLIENVLRCASKSIPEYRIFHMWIVCVLLIYQA